MCGSCQGCTNASLQARQQPPPKKSLSMSHNRDGPMHRSSVMLGKRALSTQPYIYARSGNLYHSLRFVLLGSRRSDRLDMRVLGRSSAMHCPNNIHLLPAPNKKNEKMFSAPNKTGRAVRPTFKILKFSDDRAHRA